MRVVITRCWMTSSSKVEPSSRLTSNSVWSWNTFRDSRWFTRLSSS